MQAILQHIFQKNHLQEVTLDELRQLVELYPFFAPAQLLLAKKLQHTEDTEGFTAQLQKTAVYLHNPLWLQHLLETWEAETPVESAPVANKEAAISNGHAAGEADDNSAPELGRQPLLKDMLQTPAKVDTLEFQAYHTVDYFASQGIRLRADEQPDKLDRQMKSFTEWLKTMRRLPQQARMQLDNVNEEAIYQQASTSLEEKEIVTETMAEVLAKQQNWEKAVHIYNKLGLQYPAKKAYFAAKIQALKQ